MKLVRRVLWAGIALSALCVLIYGCCAVPVDEREFVVVTMFGNVTDTRQEPGLVFINPLESVTTIPKRIQEWSQEETSPTVTGDKKNIMLSYFGKYRVVEPVNYLKSVGNPARAAQTIDDIVYSELKAAVSKRPLDEVVTDRTEIAAWVMKASTEKLRSYGVELVDFRIKRTDLPPDVIESVYKRMVAERAQMAQTYRSQGEKEKIQLQAEADRKEKEILSEAYRKQQEIIGLGDAEALRILKEAYGQDQEFALFVRSLEVYKQALVGGNARLILSTGSDLFRYLSNPAKK